jgi:WD40 repeat protein
MTPLTPRKTALAFLALVALGFAVAADGVADKPAVDAHGDPLPAHTRLRLGSLRFRQGGTVTALYFLSDRKTLVSSGDDATIRFWDADTGRELRHFQPTSGGTLSPDGTLYAAIEADPGKDFPVVRLSDTTTGKPGLALTGKVVNSFYNQVLFSPDGKVLAGVEGQNDNGSVAFLIRLWNPATGQELRQLRAPEAKENEDQPPFQPVDICFSPDGRTLLVLCNNQQNQANLRLFDAASGRLLPDLADLAGQGAKRRLQSPLQQATSRSSNVTGLVLFSPDAQLLAAPTVPVADGDDAEVRISLWKPSTGERVREVGKFGSGVGAMLFSPDGKTLAVQPLNEATVHLLDVASGKELGEVTCENGIHELAYSPDSRLLVLGDAVAQTVTVWDVAASKELHLLKGFRTGNSLVAPQPNNNDLASAHGPYLTFSPDGKTLFGSAGALIRRWKVAEGEEIRIPNAGHEGIVLGMALSSDGTRLATVSGDNTARLWDVAASKELHRFEAPPLTEEQLALGLGVGVEAAAEVALSPDGRALAVGWGSGLIQLFDTGSGKQLRSLPGHALGVHSLAFTPNGKMLISAAVDARVLWWDVATGKLLRQVAGAAVGSDNDMDLGGPMGSIGIALAPDGRTLAIAGAENEYFKLQLWEMANGKMRREFRVKSSALGVMAPPLVERNLVSPEIVADRTELPSVVFAPDSKTLAWSVNNSIRLWDVIRGEEIRRFGLAEGYSQALAFSPDGKYLTAATATGGVYVWETATGTVLGRMQGHRGGVISTAFAPGGTLLSGGADTTVLLWDVASFLKAQRTPPGELSALQLKLLWNRLADEDSEQAHEALRQLSAAPRSTVPLLREQVRPEAPVAAKRLTQLLDELEDNRFAVRKKATEELEKLAEQAEPVLQKRLDDSPPLEVKMRIEQLLQKLNGPITQPERLRTLRAIEVLELIGTPEAQEVLRSLGTGAPEARITQDAKMALARLAKRR